MTRQSLLMAGLLTIIVLSSLGCDESSIPGGILVQAHNLVYIAGLPVYPPVPNVSVDGHYIGPIPGSTQYGTVRSFPFVTTDDNGAFVVDNAVRNAYWYSDVTWPQLCGNTIAKSAEFRVTYEEPVIGWVCDYTGLLSSTNPAFATASAPPVSLTVSQAGFSTQYGVPLLRTYLQGTGLVSTSSATSVSSDGSSAVFPYPKQANGTALLAGLYAYNVLNQMSSGQSLIGLGFFSVGNNDTSMQTPLGVDVADVTRNVTYCYQGRYGQVCNTNTYSNSTPLVTSSSLGQLYFNGYSINVGSQPTAVRAYWPGTVTSTSGGVTVQTNQPTRALVSNFGSNTVSVVDLVNNVSLQTISVGTQPIAVTLKGDQTKAYVTNYGSSTVSEIDLNSNTQTRLASAGSRPEALAMDPGGTAIWVGGLNYISKVDLSSFSVIQSFSVSGQVTSLAVSAGQNSLVYTTIATAGFSTTFQAQQASISNAATQGTYAQYTMSSSSYYAQAITSGGPAPGAPGWLMSSGALVSANYGNAAALVGTPTGFALIDLIKHTQVLQGTTTSPVRGIATDVQQGVAYLTAPDSNSVLSVPLPKPESHPSDQSLQ